MVETAQRLNGGKIYTPEGGSKQLNREEVEAHLLSLQRLISLNELQETLNLTIKHDVENKTITFLGMLLNYTSEDQQNIGFSSESSTGKSYIPLELAQYFPPEDVVILGYTSPQAFFHEHGTWDEERKLKVIDLERKILIFVDQPHTQLLERLRPLLSHDRKRIIHKITDRSMKGRALMTKSVELVGYPTVVFCTTLFSLDDQERTRLLLLSPEVEPEKLRSSIELLSRKLSNRVLWKEAVDQDPQRRFLRDRITAIKSANISEIVIPEEIRERILDRFLSEHQHLIPRHQRDFPRLLGMIKAHALLNFYQRERFKDHLIISGEDVDEGYRLYSKVSKSNELGIPPEVFSFYERVFKPAVKAAGSASGKALAVQYFTTFYKTIGKKRLEKIVGFLLESGLVSEEKDPDDRRVTIYTDMQVCSHAEGYISTPKLANFNENKYPATREHTLTESINQLTAKVHQLKTVSKDYLRESLTWPDDQFQKVLAIAQRDKLVFVGLDGLVKIAGGVAP